MRENTDPLWTIDELGDEVARALSVDYEGQTSGRVRDVPDRRTIRYYTTLGLIDRPAEMRGRTALYGRRHLLQLVAIKRLQARGVSLAELQEHLVGLTGAALERLARVPAGRGRAGAPEPNRRAADFWKAAPAPVAGAAEDGGNGAGPVPTPNPDPFSLQSVRLDDDVALLLSARPLGTDDLEAIRVVAAPLLELLDKRGLLRPREEGPTP
jgi:hypothetical protein